MVGICITGLDSLVVIIMKLKELTLACLKVDF